MRSYTQNTYRSIKSHGYAYVKKPIMNNCQQFIIDLHNDSGYQHVYISNQYAANRFYSDAYFSGTIYLLIHSNSKKKSFGVCVCVDYNKSYFGRLVTHAYRQIRVGCSFYILHCCDVRIFASWLYSVKVYFIWILYNIYDFFSFAEWLFLSSRY